jgi:hypothetical protein
VYSVGGARLSCCQTADFPLCKVQGKGQYDAVVMQTGSLNEASGRSALSR